VQRPALELGDVLRRHGGAYLDKHAAHLSRGERRVMGAVAACRTAALGGHLEQCDACGGVRISYNSCRHRNCPKCQGSAQAEWLAARTDELLPVPYFHVVFTLPPAAAEIAFQNKELVYGLLMRCAAPRRRWRRSPPTKSISARASASSPCCTHGASPQPLLPTSCRARP
jgi:hypothetical protein